MPARYRNIRCVSHHDGAVLTSVIYIHTCIEWKTDIYCIIALTANIVAGRFRLMLSMMIAVVKCGTLRVLFSHHRKKNIPIPPVIYH